MPVKKSQLYKNLWEGANALRGGMDASQYKDYVLILLFLKYVSDKAKSSNRYLLVVPTGCFFEDMLQFKGKPEIGEKIDIAINSIAEKNNLNNVINVISFNDDTKLGKGQEKIDRLSDLIAIFEDQSLNFSNNQAIHDDILGDAYEFLMRHFATESGKAKGQFYTPSEVSRVIAKILNLDLSLKNPTFYDPAAGSGSLLLKIVGEYAGSESNTSCYGQEKDMTTAGLAKMNMILHGQMTANIQGGQSTISSPQFTSDQRLKQFDYVVANPPFSLKNWTQGFMPNADPYNRFSGYGIPPEKNGDFAFLLHIIASLKQTGTGAVILPHGVLFRGNAEGDIRKEIIKRKLIKAIIGLPSNLFYGTGIPACIILINHQTDQNGIFMIDASKGFIKDGNKNRLREQDIRKIVDVFHQKLEVPKYSRLVTYEEIESSKHDYNLNLSSYINNQDVEDIQDIEAHLLGGIPNCDIDALSSHWQAFPNLKNTLFKPHHQPERSKNYLLPTMKQDEIKAFILNHQDYQIFFAKINQLFKEWKDWATIELTKLNQSQFIVKDVILNLSNQLLVIYQQQPLIDQYGFYQHFMDCCQEFIQDDLYLILESGWQAIPYRVFEKVKKKGGFTNVDKGWTCDLIPKSLIIQAYFETLQNQLNALETERDQIEQNLQTLFEENQGEDGCFEEFEKINKSIVADLLKDLKQKHLKDEVDLKTIEVCRTYIELSNQLQTVNARIKQDAAEIDKKALHQYSMLTMTDVQQLVINEKWMKTIENAFQMEIENVVYQLVERIQVLMERYEKTLPEMKGEIEALAMKVDDHLRKMGFVW